jgi:hypothetical protein
MVFLLKPNSSLIRHVADAVAIDRGVEEVTLDVVQAAASPTSDLDAAADQAIEVCCGDAREAVKALIAANDFREVQLDALRSNVSAGYAHGRLGAARDRKE